MSKLVSCVSVLTLALGAIAIPQPAAARSFAARGGASAFHSDASCWTPNGAQMTNSCGTDRYWTVPLLLDGTIFAALNGPVTVTALGPDVWHNVSCRAQSTDKNNNTVFISGWTALSQFGAPRDIVLPASVPAGGTAIIDCLVAPGATVISLNW
jgi:hypothetical protein